MFAGEEQTKTKTKEEAIQQIAMRKEMLKMLRDTESRGMTIDYEGLLNEFEKQYGLESGEFAELYQLLNAYKDRK